MRSGVAGSEEPAAGSQEQVARMGPTDRATGYWLLATGGMKSSKEHVARSKKLATGYRLLATGGAGGRG